MRISEIRLTGWRSFGEKGATLCGLKRINIIIGPNNAGKSNFAKYFLNLKTLSKTVEVPKNFKDRYNAYNTIKATTRASDTWAWKNKNIICSVLLSNDDVTWRSPQKPYFNSNKCQIALHAFHDTIGENAHLSVSADQRNLLNAPALNFDQVFDEATGKYVDFHPRVAGGYDNYLYWSRFLESLIFIDPLRHFERQSNTRANFYFDGGAIIDELAAVQAGDRVRWIEFRTSMQKWLSEIMCDKVDQIAIVDKQFRIDLKRDDRSITAELSELGTGVAQIVMLLAHLHLNKDREFNVFLDEPESNLHPNSVVRLLKIFEIDLPNHNFFITTHSSVLIDQINPNWSVHRVVRQTDQPSEVFSCALPIHKFELFDDLGIRASQILQSNMIIWVEGPSDAIYLKKWISDLSDQKFHDGEHYSFLFYGGSNLRSHTLFDEGSTDAVDLMCTSRYAAIFCDTDYSDETAANDVKLKPRVTAVIDRLKQMAALNVGRNGDINDFVKIWLTDGRETENYIPEELFFEILSQPPFSKVACVEKTESTREVNRLEVESSLKGKLSFGKYDSFDVCFSKMYKRSDGKPITQTELSKIAEKYSTSKVGIAKAVVARWDKTNYTQALKREVEALIEMIGRANGIPN